MPDEMALLREWLEVLPEGRFDAFSGQIADDFVLRLPYAPPGIPHEFAGRETVREVLVRTAQGRSPLVFSDVVCRRTDDPEQYMTTCRGEALMNNGKTYRNSYIMLTRIRDGVVIEHIEYLNPLEVIAVMD